MWRLLVVCSACSTTHVATWSLQAEQARTEQQLRAQCSLLTGIRHRACLEIGPPRAPERDAWATAGWWLYESRSWESVPASVEKIGAQVVCASYVTFDGDRLTRSDEQCHRVKHYEP